MRDLQEKLSVKTFIITGAALSTLNSSLGMSITNVALPTFKDYYGVTINIVQWVVLAYLLTLTVTVVIVGRLGDLFGSKKVLLMGLILFTLSSLICSFNINFELLIAARGLQGIGGAALVSVPMSLVPKIVSKGQIGLIMGLLGTMSALGTMLGPSLGGMLIAWFGQSSIFVPLVMIGLFNYLIVYQFFPKSKKLVKFRFTYINPKGTFFLILALTCYTLSFTQEVSSFSSYNLLLVVGTIVGILLFIKSEKQAANPLVKLALFQNKNLSVGLFTNLLIALVMMTTLIVGPFYLSKALHFQEELVGLILSFGPLVSVLSGLPAGRLVDRYGSEKLLQLALCILVIATTSLAILPSTLGFAGYLFAILILTPAYQLFLAANNSKIMLESKNSDTGIIASMLSLSRNIGLISGASLMGAVFSVVVNQHLSKSSTHSILNGMKVTFLIATFLVIICTLLVFSNSRNHTSAKPYVKI